MDAGLVNIGLAFLEGLALIVSPCILPILPIILSGSLAGGKTRPFGIIFGFVVTFTVVTLFIRVFIQLTHINPDWLRYFSYAMLILLGMTMISTFLTDKFNLFAQKLMKVGSSAVIANDPQGGFWGGILFGAMVGIIWTPCAGPIFAAVIIQSVVQDTTLHSFLTVLSFAVGTGVPMLLIAMLGRTLTQRLSYFNERTTLFRKILGVAIILSVIFYICFNQFTIASIRSTNSQLSATSLLNGLDQPYQAPAISENDIWINSPALKLSEMKGKVILIDFWTYSCINCIRTLPYLKDWYAKYHNNGLVIIGIHAPEFEFEKDINNVKAAVKANGILYPVALDNDYHTWQNYKNQYWPAHYLIDKKGDVVYQHFGEGEYDTTENNIRFLLGLTGPVSSLKTDGRYSSSVTPETYLGYARADNFVSPEAVVANKPYRYSYPYVLQLHQWALSGRWSIYPDKIVSQSQGASIQLHFYAGSVYAVMGVTSRPVTVRLTVDGKKVANEKLSDVIDSQVTVINHKLYTLINMKSMDASTLELTASAPGLEIYAFTFGV